METGGVTESKEPREPSSVFYSEDEETKDAHLMERALRCCENKMKAASTPNDKFDLDFPAICTEGPSN